MGTPEFAVPVLTEIVRQGHDIAAVYTRAPKPAGRRGLEPLPSPVQRRRSTSRPAGPHAAEPEASEAAVATSQAHRADVAVVVAYGLILPKAILDAPAQGCLNLHASLLPRWRGAAPIQRAIMAGDRETGIMVMRMEEGLDTGPVALMRADADRTGDDRRRIARPAFPARRAISWRGRLPPWRRSALPSRRRRKKASPMPRKIAKAEARIDWAKSATRELHNLVRGLSPHPGAVFEADLGKGPERMKVLRSHLVPGAAARRALCSTTG